MNKFYIFIVALFVSGLGFGQELLNETLSTGSIPSGWTQSNVTFTTSAGGYANFTSTSAVLTTPIFNSSANASVDVSFDVAKFGSGGDGPLTVEYSLNGGSTWTTQGNSATPTNSMYQPSTISIPATSATMQIRFTRGNSPSQKRLRDVVIEGIGAGEGPATPTIILSETAIGGFDYLEGNGPSVTQSFNITGANLNGADVTVSLPLASDFEIAETLNGTYSNAITLPSFDGASTAIFVRLQSALTANTFLDNITIAGGGAATVDLALSGEVIAVPVGAIDLFFSEYIEGSSNNKYLEIYNGTGASVSLAEYSVELYSNGTNSVNHREDFSIGFPSTLADGEVIVLRTNSASLHDETIITYDSPVVNFNGDDAIVLKNGTAIIDIIGNIGCNPGSNWNSGLIETSEQTLVRNSDICGGIAVNPGNPPCEFPTLASEWTSYPQNTIFNLGSHTANCGSTTYTFNGTWSPNDPNGTSTASENIVITSGNATISHNTDINTITVNPGASLTIASGTTLTLADNLTLQSTSSNYASLILDGSITGTVNYERFVNVIGTSAGGGNDLITPPLNGQRFDDFAAANEGVLAASGTLRAFAPFKNDANPGVYTNYDIVNDAATILEAGVGYRAAAGDVLRFTGTAHTDDRDIVLTTATGTYGEWNLIGNPYPSYVDIATFLSHEVSPGTPNIQVLDNASGIYGYNGNASNRWEVITLSNAAGQRLAPGQGFFVASESGGGTLQFTTAMRSSIGGDDFISGRNAALVYLKLQAATNNKSYTTAFYFNENSSLGLDHGYDAKTWGGQNSGVMLYSHLAQDNTGLPIALQSLHSSDVANTIIPLGVNANAGEQLTFSIAESTLASTVEVYLEDTQTNTFTLLNMGDYTLTPNSTLNGTGRFFLRFGDNALSTTDNALQNLSIYTNHTEKTIVITGQLLEATTAQLYDLQGRLVSTTQLEASHGAQNIEVSKLSAGVYVVQLQNGSQSRTQKVMLR